MKNFLATILIVGISTCGLAQKKTNSDFEKYPETVIKVKKNAPLKNLTNPVTKSYATLSKQSYYGNKVNFAGHYILLEIGDGWESDAVIADVKTGKVYDLPVNEQRPFTGEAVYRCAEVYPLHYKPNSKLLIIYNFEDEQGQIPTKNQYVWNDKTKTFKKIKSEKLICKKSETE